MASDRGIGYTLAVIGDEKVRTGVHLGSQGIIWAVSPDSEFRQPAENDFGTSLALDFDLGAREARTVRYVLAWFAPLWKGEGTHCYTHMYSTRYPNSLAVAQLLARDHASILGRISQLATSNLYIRKAARLVAGILGQQPFHDY